MKLNLRDVKIWVDLINMFLGAAIIILALIELIGGTFDRSVFGVIYVLGTAMFLLNAVRSFRDRKVLALIFLILAAAVAAGFVLTVRGI